MLVSESAELFVREKYSNLKKSGSVLYLDHLKGIVSRLKNLGISDSEVLAAAWLYGSMDDAKITFEEIDKRFGSRVAVLALALFKDTGLSKERIEKQYVKQLMESPTEAKIIKLCEISTCLKELKDTLWSKTRRTKEVKKKLHHLNIIKPELSKIKNQYPGIDHIISGINDVIASYSQRPINI